MINKDRYIALLTQILTEHYNTIKEKDTVAKDRQQYIDGYMTAARALGACDYEELKVLVDKVHFEAFGKTIEERRRSGFIKSSTEDDSLDIPTYIRKGILLKTT